MRAGGKAFTLVEVMLALAIAALIMAAGIAPLIYFVRMMSSTKADFAMENRERSVMNRLFLDVRDAVSLPSSASVAITEGESLAMGDNRFLAIWTDAQAKEARPMTSVVWGVPSSTGMKKDFKPGLYRWVSSADVLPSGAETGNLDPKNGRLMLPGVKRASFAALKGDAEWDDEYSGPPPKAFRVNIAYEDREASYEELMPGF
jgi:prepilin-type N-terminal cleavage/methylation domain-containing protein